MSAQPPPDQNVVPLEHVVRQHRDKVTKTLDRVLETLGEATLRDEFVRAAARRTIQNVEW